MKIGFLDSGIGGMNVMARTITLMPSEKYIYYADTDNCPYGTKSNEEIIRLSRQGVDFLKKQGCDIICIACNTATSVAASVLREEFSIPIVGVEPAVKPAIKGQSHDKRILVLATPVTVREKKLHDLIEKFDENHEVDMKAMPGLPEFAENGDFDSDEVHSYLLEELIDIDVSAYGQIVLGCTHFIHFIPVLKEIFGNECSFLDGSEGTAKNIKKICNEKNFASEGLLNIEYFRSGRKIDKKSDIEFYDSILRRIYSFRNETV